MRTDEVFRLFVIPADKRLDSTAIKRHLGVKRIRFATIEELADLAAKLNHPPFYVDPHHPESLGRLWQAYELVEPDKVRGKAASNCRRNRSGPGRFAAKRG